MTYTLTQERAIQAATVVAGRLGMVPIKPVILKDSNNTSIHLAPFPVVARVCTKAFAHSVNSELEREIEVAQHLARAGAPIVSPTTNPPAGPYYCAGTALTLWQFVDHRPALDSDSADAGEALRMVHDALANYTGTLPSFTAAIDICRDLLEDESALPALAPADRVFLIEEHDRLRRSLASFLFVPIALHGDAHAGNVLVTPDGPRWTDWESACFGPREWDLTSLPDTALVPFREVNHKLRGVLRDLRSVCVAVWCWVEPDRAPEKREAAEFHLRRLWEQAGATRNT